MIKFAFWLVRVLWRLNKQDRTSLRQVVTRWIDWDQDKTYNKIDVKKIHDGLVNHIPMGAGYVLLVSQSQMSDWRAVDVEITFSSNLSNEQAVEILDKVKRSFNSAE